MLLSVVIPARDEAEALPLLFERLRRTFARIECEYEILVIDAGSRDDAAAVFYRFMRSFVDERLTEDVGDFRLLSRGAVMALRQFRESHRFLRGLVAWLGLREALVPFERDVRHVGESKYPLFKMVRLAWTAITSFSAAPARAIGFFGASLSLGVVGDYLGRLYEEMKQRPLYVLQRTWNVRAPDAHQPRSVLVPPLPDTKGVEGR